MGNHPHLTKWWKKFCFKHPKEREGDTIKIKMSTNADLSAIFSGGVLNTQWFLVSLNTVKVLNCRTFKSDTYQARGHYCKMSVTLWVSQAKLLARRVTTLTWMLLCVSWHAGPFEGAVVPCGTWTPSSAEKKCSPTAFHWDSSLRLQIGFISLFFSTKSKSEPDLAHTKSSPLSGTHFWALDVGWWSFFYYFCGIFSLLFKTSLSSWNFF